MNESLESPVFKHIELDCINYKQTCLMPKEIAQILLNETFLFVRSLDKYGNPYIRQTIFIYEMDKCTLTFLSRKKANEEINIRGNRYLSLTTQLGTNLDPRKDSGLNIKAKAEIIEDEDIKLKIGINLLRKYSSHLIKPNIVEMYISTYDVIISAAILEIYQWNGYKSKEFTCKHRFEGMS